MAHHSPSDDEDINAQIHALKKQRNAGRRQRASAWLHKPVTYAQNGYHRMFPPKSDVTNVQVSDKKRKQDRTFLGFVIALVVVIAVALYGIPAYNANIDRLANEKAATNTATLQAERDTALQTIKDEQVKSQAQIDQLRKDVEAAKKQPTNNGVTTTAGAPLPAPNQADVDRRLTELGYNPNAGWTRNITDAAWADIANNNPGLMAVGTSFAKTPTEAAAAAANNPTVAGTYAEKANPSNWVLVYNQQCMEYDAMAYQLPDGTFAWGGGFAECGVMVWVNTASGGQFRLLCDNGLQAPPVPTVKQPSMPEVPSNPKLTPPTGTTTTPPTGTTISYPECKENCNPPVDECKHNCTPPPPPPVKIQVCELSSKTVITIAEKDFDATKHSKDLKDCADTPKDIQVCELSSKTVITIAEKDFDATKHSKDLKDCESTTEKIKVCIKDSGNQNLVEINKDEFNPAIHSTNPADCVKKVEECKPGVPVGSPICDKDPSEDPVETGNNPNDNGTPMPDPGPATDPAVPEEEAPDAYTPPAPPAPAVETPRAPEDLPDTNEGAGPETPVDTPADETVCEVCGGGIGTETTQAALVAPAAASAPAVEDNQAAVQAEANRVAAEQQAAAEAQAAAQAEANRVAAEQAAAQQAAAEQAAAAQAAAEAQAVAAAQAQAQAEQQAAAQAQADAAAKAQAAAEAQAAAKAQAEAQAKAQAEAEKAQQQEEVPTQVAKNTHKGDSDKGAKTSNNVG